MEDLGDFIRYPSFLTSREFASIARLLCPPTVHALWHVSAYLPDLHGDKKGAE